MYEELRRKKRELEEKLEIVAKQNWNFNKELERIRKEIKDKEKEIEDIGKEINDVLTEMEKAELCAKQQKAERAKAEREKTEKKIADLKNILSSKAFYYSIRKYMPEPHWKKLTKAIQSDELLTFILKRHYANRVIKAYTNDTELHQAIMEAIVSKIKTLIK